MSFGQMEPSVARYLDRAKEAPRLTILAPRFGALASGVSGQPLKPVQLDPALLKHDAEALAFAAAHRERAGIFNAHFLASIPYILEEQCRFGAALWRYGVELARLYGRPANVYTLGDAAGVTARALTQVANGAIRTLTCSPTKENRDQFFACGAPEGAAFFLGPFFEVTPTTLLEAGIIGFEQKFDVLVEDTTFQMYGPERYEPIALARRNLRDDGIFVLLEKIRHEEHQEYLRRERQKDEDFKSRYFDLTQIVEKRSMILDTMQKMEASLGELTDALQRHFSAALITWNSGNFYTFAASNNLGNLTSFVHNMLPSAIPKEFCYETLPKTLFGIEGGNVEFRKSEV
ncbi:MAG TPA: hypothetical protein PLQ56_21025 [Aggregatilineales bacterium]|nr:hypothetical protein [Aggregatilineales bacterium]HUN09103.1 hypothetical protein [Aggregatilineales bacterium]